MTMDRFHSVLRVTFALIFTLTLTLGDEFDDTILDSMQRLQIRGASVAVKHPVSDRDAYMSISISTYQHTRKRFLTLPPSFSSDNYLQDLDAPIIRGYGKTASSDDSPDVTADTAFMLASVSKVFVGAAIAVLIDQRVIQLDDDICDVIPPGYNNTACINPDFPDSVVTWRMLATHRSSLIDNAPDIVDSNGQDVSATYGPTGGYADYAPAAGNPSCPLTDVVGFYRDVSILARWIFRAVLFCSFLAAFNSLILLAKFCQIMIDKESETLVGRDGLVVEGGEPLNWYDAAQDYLEGGVWNPFEEPGSYNEYSNFAIGYIAALVEHATNQPFQDFCKENIFDPLGMNHTSWFREELPTDTVVAVPVNIAIGGVGFEDVGHYCYIDYASGQLYSTANDMALWSEAILNLGVPDLWSQEAATNDIFGCQEQDENGNFLGDQSCEFALTWELLNNAKRDALIASNFNDEDFYWLAAYRDFDWTNGVMHAGAEEGVQTQIAVLPNAGVYTVVLTNTNENDQFAAQDMSQVLLNAVMMTVPGGNGVVSPATDTSGSPIVKFGFAASASTLSMVVVSTMSIYLTYFMLSNGI